MEQVKTRPPLADEVSVKKVVSAVLVVVTTLTSLTFTGSKVDAAPRNVSEVAVGSNFTCALSVAGVAQCWGTSDNGRLGNNTLTTLSTPTYVSQGGQTYVSLATGNAHACAVNTSGAAYCWGSNANNRGGDGTTNDHLTPSPVTMPSGTTFSSISAGSVSTCALTPDGRAYCWGNNGSGRLGDGTSTARSTPVAVTMPSGVSFKQLSLGGVHACAIGSDGKAYCWGNNANGRLGDGTTGNRLVPTAVTMPANTTFDSISAGAARSCAISTTGQAYCWGLNTAGALGDSTTTDRLVPTAVSQSGLTFSSISAESLHTCAVATSGAAYCWGANSLGQLGDGTTTDRLAPTQVIGGKTFASLSSGQSAVHTCGITSDSKVWCWGQRYSGRLGDTNTPTMRTTPVAMNQGALVLSSIAAASQHSCGLTTTGRAYCWGFGGNGRLGDGTTADRLAPTAVNQGSVVFVSISASGDHTCALADTGQAYCWGANQWGYLGDGTSTERLTPVPVTQGSVIYSSINVGLNVTCALSTAGQAYCWGLGGNGRIGDGASAVRNTPSAVSQGATVFTQIGVGNASACALSNAGKTFCWGYNIAGQLGDGTNTERNTPVAVSQGNEVFNQISVGDSHVCATTSGGVAFCWGLNAAGQLGIGSTSNSNVPVTLIQYGTPFTKIRAYRESSCALVVGDARTFCWGFAGYGQVGDGTFGNRTELTLVKGGNTFSTLADGSSSQHACGISASGSASCWGYDGWGQLGVLTGGDATSPVLSTYFIGADGGSVLFAATINPALSFTLSSFLTACNGVNPTSGVSVSPTAVSFGQAMGAGTKAGAQQLSVSTNAPTGFSVQVRSPGRFQLPGGTAITEVPGTNVSPAAFPPPGTAAIGYTTDDSTLSAGPVDRFTNGGAKWAALTTSNSEVFYHASLGESINTCVAYQVATGAETPAGTYSQTVVYSAVPNF